MKVGGYWPTQAAVTRVLEEIGELSEHFPADGSCPSNIDAVAEELADLWIITTAIANQFHHKIECSEPSTIYHVTPISALLELLQHAGTIARAANYYFGPKRPRTFREWIPLQKSIPKVHTCISNLGRLFHIELETIVREKLKAVSVRDQGRFGRSFDPGTSKILTAFKSITSQTKCPFAATARIWGGPEWNAESTVEENIASSIPAFFSFSKAAIHEDLDEFVISISDRFATLAELSRAFAKYLYLFSIKDPMVNRSFLPGVDIMKPGWQFEFAGTRYFVSVHSPLYRDAHIRHSAEGTFVVFQPEHTFARHKIGSGHKESDSKKTRIRENFAEQGSYPSELIDERIEAKLYMLPTSQMEHDDDTKWWKHIPD